MSSVEVWYRNPANYIREIEETGVDNIAWDYGYLVRRRIDVHKYMRTHSMAQSYTYMVIKAEGAQLFHTDTGDKVLDEIPVWEYADGLEVLEAMCAKPHIVGKPNRIVLMSFPSLKINLTQDAMEKISQLQSEVPYDFIIHGSYAPFAMMRYQFRIVTADPRTEASNWILLPTGKRIRAIDDRSKYTAWIKLLGFRPKDLDLPRNRCLYAIKSLEWAALHYNSSDNIKMAVSKDDEIDYESPTEDFTPPSNNRWSMRQSNNAQPGDMYVCNSCSLMFDCKLYREGAVCGVSGAETRELAAYFKTRDAGTIIDGMMAVAEIQADRLVMGHEAERDKKTNPNGELNPEVTKIANALVITGEKLAKLIDPSLRNPKLQINVGNGGQAAVQIGDPRQYIAAVFREFELAGIPRAKVTEQMIENVLKGMGVTEAFNNASGNPVHQILELEPAKS